MLELAAKAQPVECTNCSDLTGVIGAALAAVALIVSGYALYLGALRRPRLQVDHVEDEQELLVRVWQGPLPEEIELTLRVVVANTGQAGRTSSSSSSPAISQRRRRRRRKVRSEDSRC